MKNKDHRINITSTALEKGIDMAKDFVDKLIMPAIEETGLLIKDQMTLWKFKNQVHMLNKAKAYCEKNDISPKTISLKLLCPLLDYSGIEEDETLQDKWAILLSNMVDSEQNIENHVFPYILSQLSSSEFSALEHVYDEKKERVDRVLIDIEAFQKWAPAKEVQIKDDIKLLNAKIVDLGIIAEGKTHEELATVNAIKWTLLKEKRTLESELRTQKIKEYELLISKNKPEPLSADMLKEFEISNLIRLGLIKEVRIFYANSQTLDIPKSDHSYTSVDLNIDVDSDIENLLTELGELFVAACKEKIKIKN